MLREWEDDHLSPGWNMVDIMGERIRSLINVKLELANFIHFSRLFQSQLLQVNDRFLLSDTSYADLQLCRTGMMCLM